MTSRLRLSPFVRLDHQPEWFAPVSPDQIVALSQRGPHGFRDSEDLIARTGIQTRRTLAPGRELAGLCRELAREVRRAGDLKDDQPATTLISCTHPDFAETERLHDSLQLRWPWPGRLAVRNVGCTGFLEILREGAAARAAGAEEPFVLLAVESPQPWHSAADRAFVGILSAGAAGTVLGHARGDWTLESVETRVVSPELEGSWLFERMTAPAVDWSGQPRGKSTWVRMNPAAVRRAAGDALAAECRAALGADAGRACHDDSRCPRWVIPHQASGPLLRDAAGHLAKYSPSSRLLSFLEHMGNALSASLPTALALWEEGRGDLPLPGSGERAALLAVGGHWGAVGRQLRSGHALLRRDPG